MTVVTVAGFLPSRSGLHFPNWWPHVPTFTIDIPHVGSIPVGDASNGLCGGMVFTARDYFETGAPPPPETEVPGPETVLYQHISRRLRDSFNLPWGPARYYELMQLSDEDHFFFRGAARRTVQDEWPLVRAEIDAGRPCPVGLVTVRSLDPWELGKNHQVLAYGYEDDEPSGRAAIRVYDPNRPDDDGARIELAVADGGTPTFDYPGGVAVRAFFRTPYSSADPPAGA